MALGSDARMRARAHRCCCPPESCPGFWSATASSWNCRSFSATSVWRRALVPDGRGDVLPHRHVGEQGVLLEQIPHPPPLGRQVDPGGAVIQGDAVQLDVPLVRRQDARYALEGHGLAAPGGSQQGQRLVPGLKPDLQAEVSQLLLNVHGERHYRPPPFPARLCRASSRFTASRNTAEMAMFTSTQRRASASLLVRQSW